MAQIKPRNCGLRISNFGSGQLKLSFSFLLSQFRNPKFKIRNCFIGSPVRPHQHVRWDCKADLLGGFQVDHQLELRRLLDLKSGRFAPLRVLVDVCCGVAEITASCLHLRIHRTASLLPVNDNFNAAV
jgi:hypothetical protein